MNESYTTWGGSGITKDIWDYITSRYEKGSSILEFGSGDISTVRLSELYDLTSFENLKSWADKVSKKAPNAKVIHAPCVDMWYDKAIVEKEVANKQYDLIIVDGPAVTDKSWREPFLEHYKHSMFDKSSDILIDDVYRDRDMNFAKEVYDICKQENDGISFYVSDPLQFAVIEKNA